MEMENETFLCSNSMVFCDYQKKYNKITVDGDFLSLRFFYMRT